MSYHIMRECGRCWLALYILPNITILWYQTFTFTFTFYISCYQRKQSTYMFNAQCITKVNYSSCIKWWKLGKVTAPELIDDHNFKMQYLVKLWFTQLYIFYKFHKQVSFCFIEKRPQFLHLFSYQNFKLWITLACYILIT